MDAVALWTALGVLAVLGTAVVTAGGTVFGVIIAQLRRQVADLSARHRTCEREMKEMRGQLTEYLIRLTQAEHDRREAEQFAVNLKASYEMLAGRGK